MITVKTSARRWSVDALAAVVVASALCLRVATPLEEEAVPPDWRAYGLMILVGVALLVRRRYPLGVLYGSVVVLLVYYNLGFGAVGAIWPLAPALFNAALLGRWRPAAITAGMIFIGSSAWRLFIEREESTLLAVSDMLTELFIAVTVILAGAIILNHRLLRSEVQARERAVAAERDAEARSRLTEQRLHIAREIHDIVAHSLSGIGVQARLAEEVLEIDPDEARHSIRSIIDATSDAIGQLRETVGGLRSAPVRRPTLRDIVDGVSGVDVELLVEGADGAGEDKQAEEAIRAIVREALTNVVRHSGASKAHVTLTRRPDAVMVEIADNGHGGDFVAGYGIRGMQERAASVGGSLQAGPSPGGGFRVTLRIPR